MPPTINPDHVAEAMSNLGHYRVLAAQEFALEGEPDGISGALLLSLGLRETALQNINNPTQTDKGCFQITELYHGDWLRKQPGCPVGTWKAVPGHSAIEDGYCPRYTPALVYAVDILHQNQLLAVNKGLFKKASDPECVRFAIAAYNAGFGGALEGHRAGDVDLKTTGKDYSAWVLAARTEVNRWLVRHPNWTPEGYNA